MLKKEASHHQFVLKEEHLEWSAQNDLLEFFGATNDAEMQQVYKEAMRKKHRRFEEWLLEGCVLAGEARAKAIVAREGLPPQDGGLTREKVIELLIELV